MKPDIQAIFIDLGNTLRVLVKDEEHMDRARHRICELLGTTEDPKAFCVKLDERYKAYRVWAFETMKEAPEAELWTRWLAYDFPEEIVAPLGTALTFEYRQSLGRRVVVDQGREVLEELHRRGYILGIISNLIGTREIQKWLQEEDLDRYFKSVALSSVLGVRKPDPAIYHEAARQAGVLPEHSAYVGDNPRRDVEGTRRAGFAKIVLIIPQEKLAADPLPEDCRPDLLIHKFRELLDHFPARVQEAA